MTRHASSAVALAAAVLLSACTIGPDFVPPELDVPDTWHRELTEGLESGEADLQQWWKAFDDPVLEEVLERAATNNYDLKIAFQRVIEAQALRGIAASYRWPDIQGFGSAFAQQDAKAINPFQEGEVYSVYTAGADAVWEIDIWGRITRMIESADADLQATAEGYRDVLVVLLAQTAIEYVELRSQQQRLQIAERNIELQERTLALTQDRFAAELVSELDVRQAELNLSRTRSAVPEFRSAIEQTQNRIEVLLGENPGSLRDTLSTPRDIPTLPESVLVSGPIDALRHRPDVRQAERALAAQTARIGVAVGDLYPRFTLSGSLGLVGITGNAADSFGSGGFTWALGPQFRWNLFNGGRVQSNIDAEKVRTEQALLAYQQTVLLALEEIENAIIAYTEQIHRLAHLADSVQAAQASVELVDTLYRVGRTDFQNVLDMQRSLVQQQDRMVESRALVVKSLIRLYKALGGGWDPGTTPPEEPSTEDAPQ